MFQVTSSDVVHHFGNMGKWSNEANAIVKYRFYSHTVDYETCGQRFDAPLSHTQHYAQMTIRCSMRKFFSGSRESHLHDDDSAN